MMQFHRLNVIISFIESITGSFAKDQFKKKNINKKTDYLVSEYHLDVSHKIRFLNSPALLHKEAMLTFYLAIYQSRLESHLLYFCLLTLFACIFVL